MQWNKKPSGMEVGQPLSNAYIYPKSMKLLNMEPEVKHFGQIEDEGVLAEDEHFWVVPDKYPVSSGHTLIIAKSSKSRYHDLNNTEKLALLKWIDWTMNFLNSNIVPKPDGFNLGVNDGQAAGQTKEQFHFHIIPRFVGDQSDPRGGVRNVIPHKAKYWSDRSSRKI